MLFPLVALSAIIVIALGPAAANAQATFCAEDNLLRAFQHTPSAASLYCSTPTGNPRFIPVTTYPPTRLSSACSCFSRFPTEPTLTPSTLAASTPCFQYWVSGAVANVGDLDMVVTLDPSAPCSDPSGRQGYSISDICGSYNDAVISFTNPPNPNVNCFFLDDSRIYGSGWQFQANGCPNTLISNESSPPGSFTYNLGDCAQGLLPQFNGTFLPICDVAGAVIASVCSVCSV